MATISELATYLRGRSAGHDTALRNLKTVRFAINRKFANLESPITDDDEIAFFRPSQGLETDAKNSISEADFDIRENMTP